MSKASDGDQVNKNAPYRTDRRAARQANLKHARRGRRIIVRSELRGEPDVPRIARVIVALALAEAQREAQAQADQEDRGGDQGVADE